LDIAVNAQNGKASNDTKNSITFLESKINAMKFYFKYELSKTKALAEVLMDKDVLTTANENQLFSESKT
jgi:butyryl-CoA dehydrogenase